MKAEVITAADITPEFIEAQAKDWVAAAATAKAAAEAYLTDVDNRKKSLEEQVAKYTGELAALKKERDKLAAKILDLSSRGKIEDAAGVDIQVEEQDKKIAMLTRKLKICNAADLKGDPKLYAAAKTAHAAMVAERTPYMERIAEISKAVREEIARLEKIEKELSYKRMFDPGAHGANSQWEKVNRHFCDLDRLEKEAEERRIAEYKAAKENAGHTRIVFTGM